MCARAPGADASRRARRRGSGGRCREPESSGGGSGRAESVGQQSATLLRGWFFIYVGVCQARDCTQKEVLSSLRRAGVHSGPWALGRSNGGGGAGRLSPGPAQAPQ